jgi:hypothetical protein
VQGRGLVLLGGERSFRVILRPMQRPTLLSLVAALAVSYGGCVQSVTLPRAVESSAPLRDRLAQYRELAPERMGTTLLRDGTTESTVDSQLNLANGTIVYDSSDLLSLVARESKTAQHVASARTQLRVGYGLLGGGLGMAGLGTLVFFGGASLRWSLATLVVSSGLMAASAIGMLVAAPVMVLASAASSRDAMLSFDDDFRSNLGLCEGAAGLQDCSRAPPAPRTTLEPAPRAVHTDASNVRLTLLRLRF